MDDATLIKECVKGNAKAQRFLFEKFAPKMLTVCIRYAKNKSDAEDVLQDAFIKVFNKISEFKKEGSLEGWIRRIMVNTSLDQIRKNSKFSNDTDLEAVSYKLENNDFTFENLVSEDLLKLINSMPNGYRIVFNMFALISFGSALEHFWGGTKFLFFYISCGLGAALIHSGVNYYEIHSTFTFS